MGVFATSNMARITFLFCALAIIVSTAAIDTKVSRTVDAIVPEVTALEEESGASIDICSTINTKAGDLATKVCDKVTEKSSTVGSVCTKALDALMEKLDAKCTETVGEELVQEESGASIDICSTINTKAGDLATQVCDKVTEKSSTVGSYCT